MRRARSRCRSRPVDADARRDRHPGLRAARTRRVDLGERCGHRSRRCGGRRGRCRPDRGRRGGPVAHRYELADPLDVFYQPGFSRLDPQLLRNSIILANPDLFGEAGAGATADDEATTDGGDGGGGGRRRLSTSPPTLPAPEAGRSCGRRTRRADRRARRLRRPRRVRSRRTHRRRRHRDGGGRSARQPHPLSRDGRRRRRGRPLRVRRVDDHGAVADQRATFRSSILELRGPVRAPGRGPEPDRRTRRGRRGARGRQPRTDRRRRPSCHRARQRSRRGPVPGLGSRGRDRSLPGGIGERRVRRRRRGRSPRLHPGHGRGVRDLRRARRRPTRSLSRCSRPLACSHSSEGWRSRRRRPHSRP